MISPTDILHAKTLKDFVFVRVPGELNDFAGFVKDEFGNEKAILLGHSDGPGERQRQARIYGEVIAAPDSLTGYDVVLDEKYPGSPKPQQYRGHEFISNYIRNMPPKTPLKERLRLAPKYNSSNWTPENITLAGHVPEVEVGDRVYFHYNCLLNIENFCWREPDGQLVYQIHYQNMFCAVRQPHAYDDGLLREIVMLNGYVLVSKVRDLQEEFDVGGAKVSGRMNGKLLLIENEEDVKGNTKAKYLSGILEHVGTSVGEVEYDIAQGARVLFRPNSQFENEIEGKTYYVMRQWDLVAVLGEPDIIIPIGDWVLIKPEEQVLSKNTQLVEYNANKPQEAKPGTIYVPEGSLGHNRKLTKVGFGQCNGERVAYFKSSYYMYVKEFDMVLVRKGDVMGTAPGTPKGEDGDSAQNCET